MLEEMKQVTKKEFDKFIEEYPADRLSVGHTTICDPPLRHFRDESLPTTGKCGSIEYFFDKEVARIVMDRLGNNGEEDNSIHGKFWTYHIKETE